MLTNDNKACEVGEKYVSLFVEGINQIAPVFTVNILLVRDIVIPAEGDRNTEISKSIIVLNIVCLGTSIVLTLIATASS